MRLLEPYCEQFMMNMTPVREKRVTPIPHPVHKHSHHIKTWKHQRRDRNNQNIVIKTVNLLNIRERYALSPCAFLKKMLKMPEDLLKFFQGLSRMRERSDAH